MPRDRLLTMWDPYGCNYSKPLIPNNWIISNQTEPQILSLNVGLMSLREPGPWCAPQWQSRKVVGVPTEIKGKDYCFPNHFCFYLILDNFLLEFFAFPKKLTRTTKIRRIKREKKNLLLATLTLDMNEYLPSRRVWWCRIGSHDRLK